MAIRHNTGTSQAQRVPPGTKHRKGTSKFGQWWSAGILTCFVLMSCGTPDQSQTATSQPQPTPSVASFFGDTATHIPTIAITPGLTATPALTATPKPTSTLPTPTALASSPELTTSLPLSADQYSSISIYDEKLNANWSVANSQAISLDLGNKAVVHDGKIALAAKPTKQFGKLLFTVRKDAKEVYDTNKVLGVRFWLSGGPNMIATSDLAISIVGSNQYKYWLEGDTSVHIDATITPDSPLFSETRLYDLGINRSIEPKEWVEVIVWLDKLIYDPPYQYLTGIYIKNDQEFLDPFYLDHVDLLLQP